MRKIAMFFLLVATATWGLQAQSETQIIKEKVDEALRTHIKKLYPPKNCERNGSAHFYMNQMKFVKNQEVGSQLRLWGQAKVTYRNARTGGNTAVEFYAVIVKVDGEIELDELRWKVGRCMKFETLYKRKNG